MIFFRLLHRDHAAADGEDEPENDSGPALPDLCIKKKYSNGCSTFAACICQPALPDLCGVLCGLGTLENKGLAVRNVWGCLCAVLIPYPSDFRGSFPAGSRGLRRALEHPPGTSTRLILRPECKNVEYRRLEDRRSFFFFLQRDLIRRALDREGQPLGPLCPGLGGSALLPAGVASLVLTCSASRSARRCRGGSASRWSQLALGGSCSGGGHSAEEKDRNGDAGKIGVMLARHCRKKQFYNFFEEET